MADLTALAFELADRYRNPVVLAGRWIHRADDGAGRVCADGHPARSPPKWAVLGTEETRGNLINSLFLNFDEMEAHLNHLEAKYHRAEELETRAEEWQTEDAEIVLVGYGIVARILKAVAAEARADGLKVGVLRPITLYPFPKPHFQRLAKSARLCRGRDEQRTDAGRCAAGAERRAASGVFEPHGRERAVARGSA
jgi:pyruvate/2-oxoacid:ferredoxin oxidoreductase alpha subunit